MSNKDNNFLAEEVNSYIQKRIPDMASSIVEARLPRPLVSFGRRIGYGANQMGSLVKELGYKVRRNLEKSGAELKTDLHQIADINLTKDENILMRKHGLDPEYVRQALSTYPTHKEIQSRYPTPPKEKNAREKYESLLGLAKERQEVENALTHAKFINPQLAKTMQSKKDYETSELKNIAKRKQLAGLKDEFSKKIEAERKKRKIRARAFNIAQKRP